MRTRGLCLTRPESIQVFKELRKDLVGEGVELKVGITSLTHLANLALTKREYRSKTGYEQVFYTTNKNEELDYATWKVCNESTMANYLRNIQSSFNPLFANHSYHQAILFKAIALGLRKEEQERLASLVLAYTGETPHQLHSNIDTGEGENILREIERILPKVTMDLTEAYLSGILRVRRILGSGMEVIPLSFESIEGENTESGITKESVWNSKQLVGGVFAIEKKLEIPIYLQRAGAYEELGYFLGDARTSRMDNTFEMEDGTLRSRSTEETKASFSMSAIPILIKIKGYDCRECTSHLSKEHIGYKIVWDRSEDGTSWSLVCPHCLTEVRGSRGLKILAFIGNSLSDLSTYRVAPKEGEPVRGTTVKEVSDRDYFATTTTSNLAAIRYMTYEHRGLGLEPTQYFLQAPIREESGSVPSAALFKMEIVAGMDLEGVTSWQPLYTTIVGTAPHDNTWEQNYLARAWHVEDIDLGSSFDREVKYKSWSQGMGAWGYLPPFVDQAGPCISKIPALGGGYAPVHKWTIWEADRPGTILEVLGEREVLWKVQKPELFPIVTLGLGFNKVVKSNLVSRKDTGTLEYKRGSDITPIRGDTREGRIFQEREQRIWGIRARED